jgi:hypothetical protein
MWNTIRKQRWIPGVGRIDRCFRQGLKFRRTQSAKTLVSRLEVLETQDLPPRDRHDPGLIRAQYGIVHDFGPESPPLSLSLESTPFCDLTQFSSTLHGRVCSVKLCRTACEQALEESYRGDLDSTFQYHKRGSQVSLSNCADMFCFLEDFGVFVCK